MLLFLFPCQSADKSVYVRYVQGGMPSNSQRVRSIAHRLGTWTITEMDGSVTKLQDAHVVLRDNRVKTIIYDIIFPRRPRPRPAGSPAGKGLANLKIVNGGNKTVRPLAKITSMRINTLNALAVSYADGQRAQVPAGIVRVVGQSDPSSTTYEAHITQRAQMAYKFGMEYILSPLVLENGKYTVRDLKRYNNFLLYFGLNDETCRTKRLVPVVEDGKTSVTLGPLTAVGPGTAAPELVLMGKVTVGGKLSLRLATPIVRRGARLRANTDTMPHMPLPPTKR